MVVSIGEMSDADPLQSEQDSRMGANICLTII